MVAPGKNEIAFPRGSEWRRWDLQVHTPYSVLNNGFGSDFPSYARELFTRAVAHEIVAIGITDYLSIEGYRQLRSLVGDHSRLADLLGEEVAEKAAKILLLPNVEFRLREVIEGSRVNFHVLFSNDLDIKDIEEGFLNQLYFTYGSDPVSSDSERRLTKENLIELGEKLRDEETAFRNKSALMVGTMNAAIDHEAVSKVLHDHSEKFGGRYVMLVPADEDLPGLQWEGQSHHIRKLLIRKCQMLYSGNPKTREWGLGLRDDPDEPPFAKQFGSLKPCVHGSDAHKPEELFDPDNGRKLWIKADPTFDGLRQLIHEPENRVFIGEEPPALRQAREKATRHIADVAFSKKGEVDQYQMWFSGSVPINAGLVAVIGRKGSGKSALADVLALLGNAGPREDYSFLQEARFLSPKLQLGRRFEARLAWLSGDETKLSLDAELDDTEPELVKYIPQSRLEKLCAEIQESTGTRTEFDRELEAVIFSHVKPEDRLGKHSLGELVEHLTSERDAKIQNLQSRSLQVNREIVTLKQRLTPAHRRELENRLQARERDLAAHDKSKPAVIPEPASTPEPGSEDEKVVNALQAKVEEIESLDARQQAIKGELEKNQKVVASADRLLQRIQNLNDSVTSFIERSQEDAALLGVDLDQVVTLKFDDKAIQKKRRTAATRVGELQREHGPEDASAAHSDPSVAESVSAKRKAASEQAAALRKRLDQANRQHQEYLRDLKHWAARRAEILGGKETPDSVEGLRRQLEALKAVSGALAASDNRRDELLDEIFSVKSDLLADYSKLYEPVQHFMRENPLGEEQDGLSFDAVISVEGLVDGFLNKIHRGRKGSFQGEYEGRQVLRELTRRHNFSSSGGVKAFLEELAEYLNKDKRDDPAPTRSVADQLREGVTLEQLYDYLYGLDYLQPRFELLWRSKPLDQLSPGERGTLLLIFYLLIDIDDRPLVIDQPEENLDNETIARLLVPAIQRAKSRRQVVMVTHNPNLAVVCDADQVIHAEIDKSAGNSITYVSGSIEEPAINRAIVDVLEGTKPAFDKRDDRYDLASP